jgi:D-amino-acid dehydrogenase
MNDLKDEFNNSFNMIEKGCWMLYRTEKTGDHEKHLAEQAENLGLKTIVCDAQKVQDYEPEVELNVKGGVLYLDDCHIDTAKFMRDMFSYLQRSGVEFLLNTEVNGFETHDKKIKAVITDKNKFDCDELLIANGSWMPEAAKMLGIKMLMQPGKGYSVVYNDLKKNLHYPSILVDDRVATTPIDRWLRIGGTMELSGHSDNILPKRVMAIYDAFKKYYPSLNLPQPDVKKAWYGYRPVTPDGLPYIGMHSKFSNMVVAGGHAMLGVSAAAGTGKLITEIISGSVSTIDTNAFAPGRF